MCESGCLKFLGCREENENPARLHRLRAWCDNNALTLHVCACTSMRGAAVLSGVCADSALSQLSVDARRVAQEIVQLADVVLQAMPPAPCGLSTPMFSLWSI